MIEFEFNELSFLMIEVVCVRFILICYVINLNLILVNVVEKLNKIEVVLFYDLIVKEFYVVIWKLFIVCIFEVMSYMLGVS